VTEFAWVACAATGLGSLPGNDPREAARIVAGELTECPHLPELPERGPGADPIGRTTSLLPLADFGLETTPTGWRITGGDTKVMRRAVSLRNEDADALQESTQGYRGPIKAQIVGPWTLAAGIELPGGERMLRDPGACRELAAALADACTTYIGELQRRFPDCSVLLQIDEPAVPAVLTGAIGTASGLSSYRAVEASIVERALSTVLAAARAAGAWTIVGCPGAQLPVRLLVAAGAQGLAVDLVARLVADEDLGWAWEQGLALLAGSVQPQWALDGRTITDTAASAAIRDAAFRLGLQDQRFMSSVLVTPASGLAALPPDLVRVVYAACRSARRALLDEAGEGGHEHD
jgi:hypothetical protein